MKRIVLVVAAMLAVWVDPGPVHAATIPPRPAVCFTGMGTPIMTSLSIDPSLDVTFASKRLHVAINATDATKNLTSITVAAESRTLGGVHRTAEIDLSLFTGTRHNGTWTGNALIPRWTTNGTWQITSVSLNDAGGGFAYYVPTGGGTSPWSGSWPKTFTVTSSPDIHPPSISSLTLSRTKVDTTKAQATVSVKLSARDSLSGVARVSVLAAPESMMGISTTGPPLHRVGGSAAKGTWQGTFTVPQWGGAGTHAWPLSVEVTDRVGNVLLLSGPQLKSRRLPSSLRVTSRGDTGKPALRSLSFSRSVDARAGDRAVKLKLTAVDSMSGVTSVAVVLKGPTFGGISLFAAVPATRSSVRSVTIAPVMPQCSQPGIWTVSVDVYDDTGNYRHYSPAALKAKGLPSTINVKALDAYPPYATVPATTGTASLTVTFSEPTLWTGGTAQTALTVTDLTSSGGISGNWSCANAAHLTVTCDADGADVVTATLAPSAPLVSGHTYEVTRADGDIFDTSGNELLVNIGQTTAS